MKPKTIWDVEKNDVIVHLSEDGKLREMYWNDNDFHRDSRALGFEFLTEEEAEARAKMLRIETQLIRLGGRREFKVNSENWNMIYDPEDESITVQSYRHYTLNDIYFDDRIDLLEAILEIGYSRMIREYFKPRIIKEKENE